MCVHGVSHIRIWFFNLPLKTTMSTKIFVCTSVTSKKFKCVGVSECVCLCVGVCVCMHKAVHKPIRVVQLLHKLLCSISEGSEENRVQKVFNKF